MSQEMEFKNIVAQYSKVKPEEMTGDMRFREDLGFTSLDFMSFLGELEDTFDIELDENEELPVYENFVWASLGQIKEMPANNLCISKKRIKNRI